MTPTEAIQQVADLPPQLLALLVAALTARGRRRQLQRLELRDELLRALARDLWARVPADGESLATAVRRHLRRHPDHHAVVLSGGRVPGRTTIYGALAGLRPADRRVSGRQGAQDGTHGNTTTQIRHRSR